MSSTLPRTAFDNQALQGRVAVVTGASGGLGLAICEHLRAAGASVVQLDISYPAEPAESDGVLTMHCDIAEPASVAAMAEQVRSRFGRCDVLVNNAGITASPVGLHDFPIELWDRIFRVNLRGALLCAQALVPMMFDQQAGSIVNVASIGAQVPTRNGTSGRWWPFWPATRRRMSMERTSSSTVASSRHR
jgi:NAD(P)-dependent dehydrogenase (short-subunit alcohol dehydrogenase family)